MLKFRRISCTTLGKICVWVVSMDDMNRPRNKPFPSKIQVSPGGKTSSLTNWNTPSSGHAKSSRQTGCLLSITDFYVIVTLYMSRFKFKFIANFSRLCQNRLSDCILDRIVVRKPLSQRPWRCCRVCLTFSKQLVFVNCHHCLLRCGNSSDQYCESLH